MSAKIAPPPVPPLRGGDAFGRPSTAATSAPGGSAAAEAAGAAAAGSGNPPVQSAALSTSAPASMAPAPAAPMPTSAVGGIFATSPTGTVTPSVAAGIAAARRPSPWHELAHSLSTTSLRTRTRTPSTPPAVSTPPDSAVCGTESQALRDWDRLVAAPDSDAVRHALVTSAGSGSPSVYASSGAGSPTPSVTGTVPKLAAERDKEGHIEYKLKLIDPSPERFERLVTQMMWRLKQGRNEAIYELGLADDGTVIGLTRPEMDASLRTLERMASEVGATVIVLKEIVLTAPRPPSPTAAGGVSTPAWLARRPDLDDLGRPRKGTRGLNGAVPEFKSRRDRRREAAEAEAPDDDTAALDDDSDTSAFSFSEPPAFHLDAPPAPLPDPAVRAEQKRRKSAARREQRRLDLLRGDGTSLSPLLPAGLHQALEHQPARPSSLRLSTYVAPSPGSLEAATAATARAEAEADAAAPHPPTLHDTQPSRTPDDAFVDSLRLPLDRLSLSFADVRTDKDEVQGVYDVYDASDAHDELICVEALVVRKPQGDEWEYGGDDDGWGLSVGEEDGWGFGDE